MNSKVQSKLLNYEGRYLPRSICPGEVTAGLLMELDEVVSTIEKRPGLTWYITSTGFKVSSNGYITRVNKAGHAPDVDLI